MKLKNITLKSSRGELLDHALAAIIGVFAFFIILFIGIYYFGALNTSFKANRLAEKYLLKVESYGYLTSSDTVSLEDDLSKLGLKNVSLGGTTFNKADNGEDVELDIHYTQTIKTLKINNLFDAKFIDEDKSVEIPLSSTAKN